MKQYIGPISLITIGILYGLSGVIAKYLSAWLDPYQVVLFRFVVAFAITLIILFISKNKITLKKIDKTTLLIFSISFPVSAIFFTLSVFNTKVSLAVFSFYIANLVSSFILGAIFFHEKIDNKKIAALFFILLALIAFTNPFQNFSLDLGFIYGLISGVIQTVASMFQKIVGKSTNRLGLVLIQTFTGILIALLAIIFTGSTVIAYLPPVALGIGIIFGITFLLISYLFLIGFQKTNLNVGSILVSSELLFGPFFAFLFIQEFPAMLEVVGGIFTIIAVILANF